MPITFADVPLLLEDPGHEFQAWLDRSLSLDDMRLFGGDSAARTSTRNQPRSQNMARAGLPLPNWPAPPRPKINTLWIPTGATRWSVGLFLVDAPGLQKIIEAVPVGRAGTLSINAGSDWPGEEPKWMKTPRKFSMYLLPPRQLTQSETGAVGYLLALVDRRYFWQFLDAGTLQVAEDTTWRQVLTQLASQLEVPIKYKDVPAAYHNPDPTEFTRRYENAAVLLDAVAWCIGTRVVYDNRGQDATKDANIKAKPNEPEGQNKDPQDEVYLLQASESESRFKENLGLTDDRTWQDLQVQIAGGKTRHDAILRPASVRVVYPKYLDGVPLADGDVFAITKAGKDYATVTMRSTTAQTFFDTAPAHFLSGMSGGIPSNNGALDALADQIAKDYYAHLRDPYDVAYAGLIDWKLTGFDDFVWYHVGYQNPRRETGEVTWDEFSGEVGDYTCFTRVCSGANNFGVMELLHWPKEETSSSSSSSSSDSSSSSSSSDSSSSSSGSSASSGSGSVSGSQSASMSTGSYSGSDKSTAIVPASWSPTGFTALFVNESPEVRFDDLLIVRVPICNTELPIDPKFLEVCERDSVEICGCVPDLPLLVGAFVVKGKLCLRFAKERPAQTVQLVIRLTGIRKGFLGHRFPDRTQEQFEANEAFIRSAYPGA